jgi:hypothetical protein
MHVPRTSDLPLDDAEAKAILVSRTDRYQLFECGAMADRLDSCDLAQNRERTWYCEFRVAQIIEAAG